MTTQQFNSTFSKVQLDPCQIGTMISVGKFSKKYLQTIQLVSLFALNDGLENKKLEKITCKE